MMKWVILTLLLSVLLAGPMWVPLSDQEPPAPTQTQEQNYTAGSNACCEKGWSCCEVGVAARP